jgi:hypothetical protein
MVALGTTALALVAINYALIGPAGFQKRAGRLSLASSALLAPYLAGAHAKHLLRTAVTAPLVHVVDGVCIGRLPSRSSSSAVGFASRGRSHLRGFARAPFAQYTNIQVLDSRSPTARRSTRGAGDRRRRAAGRVLVCCALGYRRGARGRWRGCHDGRAAGSPLPRRARSQRATAGVLSDAHLALIAALAPNGAQRSRPSLKSEGIPPSRPLGATRRIVRFVRCAAICAITSCSDHLGDLALERQVARVACHLVDKSTWLALRIARIGQLPRRDLDVARTVVELLASTESIR